MPGGRGDLGGGAGLPGTLGSSDGSGAEQLASSPARGQFTWDSLT